MTAPWSPMSSSAFHSRTRNCTTRSIDAWAGPCRNLTEASACGSNGLWGAPGNDSSTSGGTRDVAMLLLGRQVTAQQITDKPMRHLSQEQSTQRGDDHHTEHPDRVGGLAGLRDQECSQALRGARVLDDDRADEREACRGAHTREHSSRTIRHAKLPEDVAPTRAVRREERIVLRRDVQEAVRRAH